MLEHITENIEIHIYLLYLSNMDFSWLLIKRYLNRTAPKFDFGCKQTL